MSVSPGIPFLSAHLKGSILPAALHIAVNKHIVGTSLQVYRKVTKENVAHTMEMKSFHLKEI